MSEVVPGPGPEDEQTWEKLRRDLAEAEVLDKRGSSQIVLRYASRCTSGLATPRWRECGDEARRCHRAFRVYCEE